MLIRCPRCGADNRDAAKFCSVCGGQMPSPQPLPSSLQRLPQRPPQSPVPTPLYQPPIQPGPSPPPPAPAMPKAGVLQTGPVVDGRVTVVDPERQEKPPFDPARALVMLSIVLFVLAALAVGAAASLAVWIAFLILGIGGLGCLFPMLMGPIYFIIGPIINKIRGEPTVLVLNFQVLDHQTGAPVDVVLYRKPGGGNVRIGDMVRVRGTVQRDSNVVRAHEVRVYESGGHPTNYKIQALKPWPIWIGVLVLGAALAAMFYMGGQIGLFD